MEIEDGGHPLFRGVDIFSDPKMAFQDAKVEEKRKKEMKKG